MESGAIADFQITASSAHDVGNVGPQHARYGYFNILRIFLFVKQIYKFSSLIIKLLVKCIIFLIN